MNRVSWKRAADLEPGDVIDSPTTASSMPRTVVEAVTQPGPGYRLVVVKHRHVGEHHDFPTWTTMLEPEQAVIVFLPPAPATRGRA